MKKEENKKLKEQSHTHTHKHRFVYMRVERINHSYNIIISEHSLYMCVCVLSEVVDLKKFKSTRVSK